MPNTEKRIAADLSRIPEIADLLRSFEQCNRERQADAAKRAPLANKLSRVFDAGVSTNYRYYDSGKNGKGQRVAFCWSVNRNCAGFYLGWREVSMKNGTTRRDQWLARRTRSRCKDIARSRSERVRGAA